MMLNRGVDICTQERPSNDLLVSDCFGTILSIDHTIPDPHKILLGDQGMNISSRLRNEVRKVIMSNRYLTSMEETALLLAETFDATIPSKKVILSAQEALQAKIDSIQRINETVPDIIKQVKQLGWDSCILSNIAQVYTNKVNDIIGENFDKRFYSCDIGHIKPEKQVYEPIDERSPVSRNKIVLGDSPNDRTGFLEKYDQSFAVAIARPGQKRFSRNNEIKSLSETYPGRSIAVNNLDGLVDILRGKSH